MRKILAFLVLLMLPWAARGQALADWYYWFDMETSPHEVGTETSQKFQITADVSHLKRGMHTLYVQVKDTVGVYSSPFCKVFYNMPSDGAKLLTFRYWFDSNATVNEKAYGQGNYLIDVTKLIPGFHFINYYVMDEEGTMTDIQSSGFYRMPMFSNQKLNYWFAGDTIATQVPNYKEGFTVDVSKQLEGFNTIYFQMEDNGPTDIETCHFIKIPQTENAGDMTLVCIIDGKIVGEEKVATHGGIVKCDMDVSNMEVGLHKAMFQLITPSGSGSSIAETYFIRTLTNDDIASMQCSYTIDGFHHRVQKGSCTNGAFHFDLPVDEVEDGLHRIDYMLVAENGATTTSGSAWFFKTPLGGNGITQYDYWLNNKSDEVQRVTLAEPKDPFQLIKLLPVTTEPIRSSCFHFENKNNQPKIYAKNDIHFRFHDRSGRWVDADNQYVDNKVSEDVVVTKQLTEAFGKETFETPDSNAIKWYSMECSYGDSIAISSSQATSLQIFAPSGKEMYSAEGLTSVEMGGCHAYEDGTFYIAIHDVTGSAQQMSLNYRRIDKYAIFEYSPSTITAEGNVIMDFKGNGFEHVKSVKLTNGETTIAADTLIRKTSDMMAAFYLDESTVTTKKFTLEVYFNNEEKNDSKTLTFKNAITMEPVNAGDIAVTITRQNRVGDPYPVQIHIKNTGNLAYSAIPFGLAFDGVDKVDDYTFENFKLLLTEERYKERDFFAYTDNLLGTGKKGLYIPMILPYLGPYEELVYTVGIRTKVAHAQCNIYAWTIEPWSEEAKQYRTSSARSNAPRKAPPCNPTNLPQLHGLLGALGDLADALGLPTTPFDLARLGLGAGEAIGGIEQGLTRANEDAVFDAYGFDPEFYGMDKDDFRMQFRYCPRSPQDIAQDFIPNNNPLHVRCYAVAKAPSSGSSTSSMASGDCPKVPPTPIDPWIPGDPNEITGYLAESGSHFINNEVVNVGYDIEFENDPEIANASAHHIVIKDTLDAKYFDFNSFEPKTVKLSGKEIELDGTYPFVKTIDLRPSIYAIAELSGDFDAKKGIATWDMIALDPMTMEPTDDIMQGILPVNTDNGNGIGNVTYTINLKSSLADGTEIPNRAGIVFDYNDAILTPTWTNIIDATAPTSSITYCELKNDSTATLFIDSSDNLSGVWKYDVYIQYGEDCSWLKVVEGDTNRVINVKIYQDINHGFYVVATDSAGNVEVKTAEREFTLDLFDDSDQTDMDYELAAGWNWISHSFNTSLDPKLFSKNALRIVGQTSELYNDEQFGLIGNLNSLNSNVCYKLQMSAPVELTIDGMIYRSAQKSVELYKGWNWIGYPLSNAMTPSQALSGFEASEGDCIIGQDGMAVYSQTEGWVGTLDTFTPGKGYMYKSDSYRRMTFNSEANVSIRANNRKSANGTGWSIDFHKYPNIMALIAQLSKDGHEIEPTDYVVAAFCGDECRGVAKNVNDKLMMNIYGEGGENIIFRAMDKETGDVFDIAEIESFSSGLLGAYDSPYMLHIGGVTDIVSVDSHFGVEPIVVKDNVTVHLFGHTAQRLTVTNSNGAYVMNLHDVVDGQVLNLSELTTGIYIVSVICGENTYNQKIVKID